jgi:hypothetical protein
LSKTAIATIIQESKELIKKQNNELYTKSKTKNTKLRSELIFNDDIENQIIKTGA